MDLVFALIVACIWHAIAVAPWPRMFAAAAGASLASALIACVAAYGIWQEWWIGVLWFSLFGVLVMARAAPATIGSMQPRPLARFR